MEPTNATNEVPAPATPKATKPKAKKAAKKPAPKKAATRPSANGKARDPRLPRPGSVLKREYKGKEHVIKVKADGFEYKGKLYGSVSGVAKAITGYGTIDGMGWFGLNK